MTIKTKNTFIALDGNEATAYVAYRTNEICIIYPITPASTMGELSDQWASQGLKNNWGTVPQIVTMQSEAGAAAAVHGALQTGALATTFTSSQGLLLMIPNMYRIAGELLPTVFHVATRAVAFQGMSIFGDHSDIYAARTTGFAMLASSSVQEAHDMALVTEATTLKSRVPFLHFFDGFRTSHEISKIEKLSDEQIKIMMDNKLVFANRHRHLTPENPTMRGIVSNPDIYFQGREATNPFYNAVPEILEEILEKFGAATGRNYQLVEYYGDPNAERVIIVMGSAAETVQETISHLNKQGEKVGLLKIRLFRPFPKKQLLKKIPKTCKAIAVLDRTKEIGAAGEPLYEDVATTLLEENKVLNHNKVIGGRYGIASKEFTPAMIKGIFDELKKDAPKNSFTIGINDDLSHTSLEYDKYFDTESDSVTRAIFYGLGSDGTVSANKNTIKIISNETDLYAQGYFVFDAKKSGSRTVSHLRFSPEKIRSTYLINSANFIGCHQFNFVEKTPVLENAAHSATFLLNSPWPKEKVWNKLPKSLQQTIIDKKIKFYIIDAYQIARDSGMNNRINTIMQVCFFALSGVIQKDTALEKIKEAIQKTYASKGEKILQQNFQAVDNTLANLVKIQVPTVASSNIDLKPIVSNDAPKFIQNIISKMIAGEGDSIPVSALPSDGVYPTNSTKWEKRNVAQEVPKWIPENCVECGLCRIACPHSALRSKCYAQENLKDAPEKFLSTLAKSDTNNQFTIQVYTEDCTGCGTCVEVCPVNKGKNNKQAIIMQPNTEEIRKTEQENISFFETLPNKLPNTDKLGVKNIQNIEPLFEFCAACAGCGETPYIKLLTQLCGDRLVIADACGCTLAYAGYLPTFPWSKNKDGRGPAFGASLFEDNAEFGYGLLLTIEKHRDQALELIEKMRNQIGETLVNKIINNPQQTNTEIEQQRVAVVTLKTILEKINNNEAKQLLSLIDQLVKQSVWNLGGDGWAYDIGYGGLDHVLASGRNIKNLILDTEVYSNTGGQASKATPRGAVVKFAMSGKPAAKKDLGLMLIPYGNIYIASVAIGANPAQTIKALQEADSYNGPAIVIAYSHCVSHGINMKQGMNQQKLAVQCGHWPLYRYNPDRIKEGLNPLQMDSAKPSIPFEEYAKNENRYQILMRTDPELAKKLLKQNEKDIKHRWKIYEALANI